MESCRSLVLLVLMVVLICCKLTNVTFGIFGLTDEKSHLFELELRDARSDINLFSRNFRVSYIFLCYFMAFEYLDISVLLFFFWLSFVGYSVLIGVSYEFLV